MKSHTKTAAALILAAGTGFGLAACAGGSTSHPAASSPAGTGSASLAVAPTTLKAVTAVPRAHGTVPKAVPAVPRTTPVAPRTAPATPTRAPATPRRAPAAPKKAPAAPSVNYSQQFLADVGPAGAAAEAVSSSDSVTSPAVVELEAAAASAASELLAQTWPADAQSGVRAVAADAEQADADIRDRNRAALESEVGVIKAQAEAVLALLSR